jgi:hypothetical protein
MSGDAAIACERIHHSRIGRDRESPTQEHGADDDDLGGMLAVADEGKRGVADHEHNGAFLADSVQKDLGDGLTCSRSHCRIVVLHGEEQAEDKEPSESGGDTLW